MNTFKINGQRRMCCFTIRIDIQNRDVLCWEKYSEASGCFNTEGGSLLAWEHAGLCVMCLWHLFNFRNWTHSTTISNKSPQQRPYIWQHRQTNINIKCTMVFKGTFGQDYKICNYFVGKTCNITRNMQSDYTVCNLIQSAIYSGEL